jgi:hypothetical protein
LLNPLAHGTILFGQSRQPALDHFFFALPFGYLGRFGHKEAR